MLIALIHNKKALTFDYYKEIIMSYRRTVDTLDIEKIQRYLSFSQDNDISWK